MAVAIFLGALQGVTEWLPVSSQGVITVAYSFFDRSLSEAVAFSLWLHVGTAFAALLALRSEALGVVQDAVSSPLRPSRLLSFLVVSTLLSVLVAFPLLLTLDELSESVGAMGMGVVGLFMLITGAVQLLRPRQGTRSREELSHVDALLAGAAQGLAVLPGLSRSGLTVAALLGRRVDRGEALVLSFLMSVPASLGAGIYSLIGSEVLTAGSAILAAAVACAVGFLTIRALLAVAERVNFAAFVIIVGAAIALGAVWQTLA